MGQIMKIFRVNGHFKDDGASINGYLIAEYDQTPTGYSDEDIFYYGIAEKDLIGEHDDFIITGYEIYDETKPTILLDDNGNEQRDEFGAVQYIEDLAERDIFEPTILQARIDDDHIDSLWYDGLIATSGKYSLWATGEMRIYRNATDTGAYMGMYDGKARDDFGDIENDADIRRIENDPDYNVDMCNWFEVVDDDNPDGLVGDTVTGDYDEAMEMLKTVRSL